MESVLSGSRETFELFDSECLKLEDCQYILRALEKRAFEYVVCALRAQGPLSQYKEVILDHLKSILFISDDDYLLRIRLSANDPILSRIAQELNPSYDNISEWLTAGYSLVSLDFPKVVQINAAADKNTASLAATMQREMAKHNACLDDDRGALLKLLQVVKSPYVPEKLRRLLHDTEKDIHGRMDIIKEKTIAKTPRHVGRPRRAESAGPTNINIVNNTEIDTAKVLANKTEIESNKNNVLKCNSSVNANSMGIKTSPISATNVVNNIISNTSSVVFNQFSSTASFVESLALQPSVGILNASPAENGAVQQSPMQQHQQIQPKNAIKVEEVENYKTQGEFSIHFSGGANVVVVDPEDQNTIKEPKVRKRRSKLVDDVTCICARVLPFIFERATSDLPKPLRGNPDKRCSKLKAAAKRASQLGFSSNNDVINNAYSYVPQQMGIPTNNYYSKSLGYINSNTANSVDLLPTPTKRTRAAEDLDDGRHVQSVMYQKPQSQQHSSRTAINTSAYSSTPISRQQQSYYAGAISTPSVSRQFTTPTNASGSDAEVINASSQYRNPASLSISQAGQSLMTTDSSGRLILQELPITEESIATEVYPDNVYMEMQMSPQQTVNARFNDVSEGSINGLYTDAKSGVQYTVGNIVVKTIDDASKTHLNSGLSQSAVTQAKIADHNSTSSSDFSFGASGLDFLASTASLLTPMQKQPIVLSQIPTSSTAAPQQIFVSSSSKLIATPTTFPASYIVTENPTTTPTGGHLSSQSIVTKQTAFSEELLTAVSHSSTPAISIPTASVVYVQNTPGIAPADTYVVDYGCQTTTSPDAPQILRTLSGLFATPSSSTFVLANPSMVITTTPVVDTPSSTSTVYMVAPTQQKLPARLIPTSTTSRFVSSRNGSSVSSHSTLVPGSSKSFATESHQATQNFLKQHASLVDSNGMPLNEEVTLGSILRSSNLRSKLLSAAAVGKASSSPLLVSSSSSPKAASSPQPSQQPSQIQQSIGFSTIVPCTQDESQLGMASSSTSTYPVKPFSSVLHSSTTLGVVPCQSTTLRIDNSSLTSNPALFELSSHEYVMVSEGTTPLSAVDSSLIPSSPYGINNDKF